MINVTMIILLLISFCFGCFVGLMITALLVASHNDNANRDYMDGYNRAIKDLKADTEDNDRDENTTRHDTTFE